MQKRILPVPTLRRAKIMGTQLHALLLVQSQMHPIVPLLLPQEATAPLMPKCLPSASILLISSARPRKKVTSLHPCLSVRSSNLTAWYAYLSLPFSTFALILFQQKHLPHTNNLQQPQPTHPQHHQPNAPPPSKKEAFEKFKHQHPDYADSQANHAILKEKYTVAKELSDLVTKTRDRISML